MSVRVAFPKGRDEAQALTLRLHPHCQSTPKLAREQAEWNMDGL